MEINYLKTVIFLAGSAFILAVSWKSLRHTHYHGFYRFFAFECILAVVTLQLDSWFEQPFALYQLISWFLLVVSIFMVVASFTTLQRQGKPTREKLDTPQMAFEKTTRLVTGGVYRFIRHPMYASLFYLGWGAFFKHPGWSAGILALLGVVFITLTAMVEEQENLLSFGDEYAAYMKRTRRFVPFVF